MKKGLVLGKFMPLHQGHIGLIEFALSQCEHLAILLCYHTAEPISGAQRLSWLSETFSDNHRVSIIKLQYDPALLPDSSEPKPEYAHLWSEKIKELLPDINIFFSSEAYGNNVAACLHIEHRLFDERRQLFPVSASLLRQKPLRYWAFLPKAVQPYFVKKVALVGSESTGKSTLTQQLASFYKTSFVPEMAREIIGHTNECMFEDLERIAERHAQEIILQTKCANKLLFCDTNLSITRSYSQFLFQKELNVLDWIEEANNCDLYLFLETDRPYVQDGTRLSESERNLLGEEHKKILSKLGIEYKALTGTWQERFEKACAEVNAFIKLF